MKRIYVGNLSYSATEALVRSLFEPQGAVARVKLVTDRATGVFRGFGFVDMSNDAEADAAIAALNGAPLLGRQMVVAEAMTRPEPTPIMRPRYRTAGGWSSGA